MTAYIINTFISERDRYYDVAAEYYQQKTNALLETLKNSYKNELQNELGQVQSVEAMFNENVSKFGNLGLVWETIYNAKMSQADIMAAIQNYNQKTSALGAAVDYKVDALVFLEQLLGQIPGGEEIDLRNVTLPDTLDFSSVKKEFDKLSHGAYGSAAAVGGARAKLFGEMFEQLMLSVIVNNIGDLMGWVEQLGTGKSYNYSGKVTSGKSDIMFAVEQIEAKSITELIKGKNKKVTKLQGNGDSLIEIDAAEAIDLEDKASVDALTAKYATGERAGIAGATVKQWISEGAKATLAHSNFTAKYINDRNPAGIEEHFKNNETFKAYTAYVLARFLINVIGVYNILVISGSHIELTSSYIERIKRSQLSIMHMTELSNSIYKAKNDVYVGNNPLPSAVEK